MEPDKNKPIESSVYALLFIGLVLLMVHQSPLADHDPKGRDVANGDVDGGTYVAESELDILSYDAVATTFTDNADDLIFTFEPSTEMVFTPDGHVEINGVPIKELDYPEIRDSIKQIADAMVSDRSVVQMCERQTEHLLSELEKCRKREVVCP